MDAGRMLREARAEVGLTQRALAQRTSIPQPVIARVESGGVVPRVDTLDRLLAGCGRMLGPLPRLGAGVDRTMIRELLKLTPGQRARLAVRETRNVSHVLGAVAA
jgi:predicted transcriptional regulator